MASQVDKVVPKHRISRERPIAGPGFDSQWLARWLFFSRSRERPMAMLFFSRSRNKRRTEEIEPCIDGQNIPPLFSSSPPVSVSSFAAARAPLDPAPLSSQRPMPTAHRAAPGRPRGTAAASRAGPGRPRRSDHADGDACATGRVARARPPITVGNAPSTPDRLGRPVARGGGFGAEPDVARAPRALVRVSPSRGSGASPCPPVAASPSPRPDRRPRRRPS